MSTVLLEARAFRPFKSSEEYLYAMKEDLAEWFQTMYAHLQITPENFMERLETGVALCEHANAVKLQAAEYVEKKKAKSSYLTRSVTSSLLQAKLIKEFTEVKYFGPASAKSGTFYARDNVSNFIDWCRNCLEIMDCLLFETDDLIMRKNEKHVILCLLEVARRGARFGMLAPMLVQMERQIDREIAADQRRLGVNDGSQSHSSLGDDTDSDLEDEDPVLMYGPIPQIITNDLKSLDEMVRDLVEKCTCPTQFPMIRVSEGKYRIGDTKVLIFVRILRNHVMVRVGGGWDTLSHYLDKHDPCRCRSQHRATQGARLVNKPGAADLHGSHVYYDRFSTPGMVQGSNGTTYTTPSSSSLGPPMHSLNRSRSRSPSQLSYTDSRRSVSPCLPRKGLAPPISRSRSPTPNFTSTHVVTKLSSVGKNRHGGGGGGGPHSLPIVASQPYGKGNGNGRQHGKSDVLKSEAVLQVNGDQLTDHSDTTSEMSDEGYRSLGIQDKSKQRSSVYSQNSVDDVEENEHPASDNEDTNNETGLRKTQFSSKLYESTDKPAHAEEPPTTTNTTTTSTTTTPIKSTKSVRERSFTRSSSIERPAEKSAKVLPPPPSRKTVVDKTGTWNGRSKSARPSLNADTFQSPFVRNGQSRRSVSAAGYGRRASSANTSPVKRNNLRDELLKTVEHVDDDTALARQIQDLLKRFGSLERLGAEDAAGPFPRHAQDRTSFRSPRKDVRTTTMSRIPAPIIPKA